MNILFKGTLCVCSNQTQNTFAQKTKKRTLATQLISKITKKSESPHQTHTSSTTFLSIFIQIQFFPYSRKKQKIKKILLSFKTLIFCKKQWENQKQIYVHSSQSIINRITPTFYTMTSKTSSEVIKNSAFRRLDAQQSQFPTTELEGLGVTNEMMQVINAQNLLIMKLLQRQNILYHQLNKRITSSDSGSGTNDKKMSGYREFNNMEQFSSSSNPDEPNSKKSPVEIIQKSDGITTFERLQKQAKFDCEINSSQSNANSDDFKEGKRGKKQTETKNMIKNYAKAIFSYIYKNKDKRQHLLQFMELSEEDFMKTFHQYKGHIHSISDLRSLWTHQGNYFHKVFRILSCQYLRKYCLARTFNSRVENYPIHMKYRHRLLDGLKTPSEFTILKIN